MLDRSYIRQQTEVKSLWKMGIALLKKHILEKERDRDITARITSIVVQRIDAERNGEEIDKTLLKGTRWCSTRFIGEKVTGFLVKYFSTKFDTNFSIDFGAKYFL